MAVIKVDVTSDVICPFCLLGVKQLEDAIAQYKTSHPSAEFEIRLLPFQLNGHLPDAPQSRAAYATAKFGAERWASIRTAMRDKFCAAGLGEPNLDGEIASTHQAHRLQTLALQQSAAVQLALAHDIFDAYHLRGVSPADRGLLTSLAVKHGLFGTAEDASRWLDGKACDDDVKRGYMRAHQLGVTGVPFFVFQDKYAASGAMGVDEFVGIINEIAQREEQSRAVRAGAPAPAVTA
ncbi:hypothetical protein Q5752_000560 [Cryptotrichosporon argae]